MRRQRLSVIFNIVIVICQLIGTILAFSGNEMLWPMRYYTVDSNMFCMVACAGCAYFGIQVLRGKRDSIPDSWLFHKYMAVCTVSVTFLVVIFVIAPLSSFDNDMGLKAAETAALLKQGMIWHHLLGPVLAIFSLAFIEKRIRPDRYRFPMFRAMAFNIIYQAIIYAMNYFYLLDGPYPFMRIRYMPAWQSFLWWAIIFVFSIMIAYGNWILWQGMYKRIETEEAAKPAARFLAQIPNAVYQVSFALGYIGVMVYSAYRSYWVHRDFSGIFGSFGGIVGELFTIIFFGSLLGIALTVIVGLIRGIFLKIFFTKEERA